LRLTPSFGVVDIKGATAGAQVAILGLVRGVESDSVQIGRFEQVLSDDDKDGRASFSYQFPSEVEAIWVAVNLSNGEWAIADTGRPGREVGHRNLKVRTNQTGTTLSEVRREADFLIARKGVGAWSLSVADGGDDDADGEQDNKLEGRVDAALAVGPSIPPAAELKAGDLVFLIDPSRFEYYGLTLTDADFLQE
jgi:hypothetical protein